ncbi:heme NO-binding domain-containing protein [Citreicella sp. C3M06]|uniref:heme NO-binding domain-containing protein n=1 Tax=Citreicella sp. C3M06 TaxID=2841564 RepID=UPI001C092DC9|nr:heme NO-binding domain-containing protein [Citreicella sp. C3M06]MBU2961178.1 heme NO-binding domain-containing protein [Citreicella sp. C3M06]
MHGLIARTLQCFLQDTYGLSIWQKIAELAKLDFDDFEAMLDYDIRTVEQVLEAASMCLEKPRDALLEDIGTYLITHPNNEGLRRLMRYGGVDFFDFLHSLEDLPGRTRLAVADLQLPELELTDSVPGQFLLSCHGSLSEMPGFGHVLVGVLRAMADDYGALVILDHRGALGQAEVIDITVVETDFAEGRSFELAAAPPPVRREKAS